ncbi:MAG TPA: cytochrome c biogenesis protein ResB [Terriglobales bacterium]|nr:cytochrome c biogenesis protein ResB [Terriglobales bacterium]
MAASMIRRLWQTFGAIKTGVILLIVTVIISAAGTLILQRPATDPDEMQRAYSPQMLRLLDGLGLTDVFHAWWFVLLLALVSLSIIAASIQRFPNSWRFYSRPYKSPDETFRKVLPHQAQIAIPDEETALVAAERVFQKGGFKPERIVRENNFSLFGERNRISEMSVYIVHASLLLIFLGGIVDALYGWRGFISLSRGQQTSQVQQNGVTRTLPFVIRCDGAGQENYADGTPKRWWSKLAVIEDGREIQAKEIVVNDPLIYQGVRVYQASYGPTGKIDKLVLNATPANGQGEARVIALGLGETLPLDQETTVRLAEFIPDFVVQDGQIYARSNNLENPAAHLVVESGKTAKPINVWLPPIPGFEHNASSPYRFEGKDVQMAYYTGLEVSHEPGQWSVWAGVMVMGFGLVFVFYIVHTRIWAVLLKDGSGRVTLWLGGAANRNKDVFEQKFRKLVKEIEAEIKSKAVADAAEHATSLAG